MGIVSGGAYYRVMNVCEHGLVYTDVIVYRVTAMCCRMSTGMFASL